MRRAGVEELGLLFPVSAAWGPEMEQRPQGGRTRENIISSLLPVLLKDEGSLRSDF